LLIIEIFSNDLCRLETTRWRGDPLAVWGVGDGWGARGGEKVRDGKRRLDNR